MPKIYVFGIGGTGSRVIKSLTMLLAAGMDMNGFEVVPIIVDPDSANGDVTRTVEIVKQYQQIQNTLADDSAWEHSFFNTPISSISENFRLEITGSHDEEFRDYIGFSSLSEANKALVSLLFSEDNLHANMEVGFKGNPNIGSVVLNQFNESEDFKKFASSFSKGDRIFIISSIFGGTGAAGFPLLLKNIRNANHELATWALLKDAPIGAISLLPYFGVWPDQKSKIDKATFISKTKAALSYYEKNLSGNQSLNALYYIGDEVNKDYENHEGSVYQKNEAHFVELAAALSVVDFVQMGAEQLQNNKGKALHPAYKEFGIDKDTETIRFNDLGNQTQLQLQKVLSQYVFFILYTQNHMQSALDLPWATGTVKIDKHFLSQAFYANHLYGFNRHFWEWLTEMKRNKRSFAPFKLGIKEKDLFDIVEGVKPKKGLFERGANYHRLDYLLSRVEPGIKYRKAEQKFMALFTKATEKLVREKYGF